MEGKGSENLELHLAGLSAWIIIIDVVGTLSRLFIVNLWNWLSLANEYIILCKICDTYYHYVTLHGKRGDNRF